MSNCRYEGRVAYDDIDADLNLTMQGAIRHMQEAAVWDGEEAGYAMSTVEKTGVLWILVGWRIRMEGTCPWGETVHVETWPRSMERVRSTRDFLVTDSKGKLLTRAESLWVLVDAHTGRATRVTPEVLSAYQLEDRRVFDTEAPEIPEGTGEIAAEYKVHRRDIDTNHHMNNRVYLEVAREALPLDLQDREFREVFVRYHRQLLLGDEVQCRYRKHDNAHVVDICRGEHLHATVVFYE